MFLVARNRLEALSRHDVSHEHTSPQRHARNRGRCVVRYESSAYMKQGIVYGIDELGELVALCFISGGTGSRIFLDLSRRRTSMRQW